jgi:hypothetical protein
LSIKAPRAAVKLLNRIINSLWKEEIEVDRGRAIVYAASVLLQAFQAADLEDRLPALEKEMGVGKS